MKLLIKVSMLRKILSIIISLLLVITGYLHSNVILAQEKVYAIAVLDLDANGVSIAEAKGLSDVLRHHISDVIESHEYKNNKENDQYKIIARTDMEKIFEEYEIQNTGCVSDSCAIEFGKILQVERIIVGRISLIGKTYSVTTRIVDVETDVQIGSSIRQHRGSIDGVIKSVMPQVGEDLLGIRKKSNKLFYILLGIAVTGGVAGSILGGADNGKTTSSTVGTLILNVTDLPDEP